MGSKPEYFTLKGRIFERIGKHFEAVGSYRARNSMEPGTREGLTDLARGLIAAATAPNEAADYRLRMLAFARRSSRELCALYPEYAKGWELLSQTELELAKADEGNADFHNREYKAALRKALKLHGGDARKLPPPLDQAAALLDVSASE